ncbi:MAG TPA: aspartate-semialdehyde dehydrogenase [Dehalococcoidia bacterium]|nr:aspartate-semialdehyde dehydrogenase [Dehalococcoidia bacterium]
MRNYHVAIVGATGLVGQEFIKILLQRRFPMASIRLLASERSVGKKMPVGDEQIEVQETTSNSFDGTEIALFSAGAEHSLRFSPIAAKAGAVVVDNSTAFRMDKNVPLVVPEVNSEDIRLHHRIIANPNCSTIQLVMALYPLHRVNPVRRVICDTYQSVSGTGGVAAVEELRTQAKQVLDGQPTESRVFPHQIAFNVLPEIDVFMDNGYSREEWKMLEETRKIMHADSVLVSATCVRVPVLVGHAVAAHIEFTHPMEVADVREVLSQAPGVKVLDDAASHLYPQPWDAACTDDVFVGRIRKDASHPNGIAMWIVADNLRKGAALNTIQIAEEMIKRDWVKPQGGQDK